MSAKMRSGVVGAVLVAVAGSVAGAQCDVYRTGVPDFDQRRNGLPGGGSTYCVPTSAMNWFAFIANNGFPDVLDGPKVWQSRSHEAFITQRLELLGEPALMATTTESGTTLGGARNGAQIWLDSFAPGAFVVEARGSSSTYTPSPLEAYLLLSYGSLPMTCFGRWNFFPATPPSQPVGRFIRDGGHCVTLTRVYDGCTPTPEMWYRDPAGFDGSPASQAPFVTQHTGMAEVTIDIASDEASVPVSRQRWVRTPLASPLQIYDGLVVIHPLDALCTTAVQGQVSVVGTYDFNTLSAPPVRVFNMPGGGNVVGMHQQPGRPYAAVLVQRTGGAALLRLNLVTGVVDTLRNFGTVGPSVIDRRGELHVHADGAFQRINIGVYPPQVIGTLTGVPVPQAMCSDDARSRTVMVVGTRLGTVSVPPSGVGVATYGEENLPSGVSMPLNPSIAVNPVDGTILIAGDVVSGGAGTIVVLTRTSAGALSLRERIALPEVNQPRSVQAMGDGSVRFISSGVGRHIRRVGTGWQAVVGSPLTGTVLGPRAQVRVARFIHGEWTGGPSDYTTEPPDGGEGVPDCRPDFNQDGVLNPDDLADYIAAFFSVPPALGSDYDDSGSVDPDDLADYIADFFAGCADV
jgi:hypothetical protein